MRHILGLFSCLLAAGAAAAPADLLPAPAAPDTSLQAYVRVSDPVVALTHVRIIDGTGGPVQQDRTLLIDHGRISAILPTGAPTPPQAKILDLSGRTVLPGIVGMHDHLFYIARPNLVEAGHAEAPLLVPQMTFSAPRLYLAGGVTTIRTAGSVETYTDLNLKQRIDAGKLAGPHMDVTGPYLEGSGSLFIQMYPLRDADDATQTVDYWADRGATSFKAYMNITRAELGAAIQAAHRHGIKVTGHLCSVTYPEAIDLGIDDLEHGFVVNTQLDSGKQPDKCSESGGIETLIKMDPNGADATALINKLVAAHVAITSTLPVFEGFFRRQTAPQWPEMLAVLTTQARAALDFTLHHPPEMKPDQLALAFNHMLAMEKKFSDAGGLLIAGLDPTGGGGVIPGFGDEREIELLVEAGFSPVAAIRIATLNGATYLGVASRIGSVEPGKNADLMVVRGDPSSNVADIQNVELVFKDGVGWDSEKLRDSVTGDYGRY
jgi:imidazolonepropionase-like amidohydrolase